MLLLLPLLLLLVTTDNCPNVTMQDELGQSGISSGTLPATISTLKVFSGFGRSLCMFSSLGSLALPLKALEAWKGGVTSWKKTGVKRKRLRQTSYYKEQEEDKELSKKKKAAKKDNHES